MQKLIRILLLVFLSLPATACIWDAQSLSREKSRSHDLATAILGEKPVLEDTNRLRDTIRLLEADPHEGDPLWLNNLAGAHLRLNEPQAAVALLEPVAGKFPNDYGIHANLGTAYHLLGRYADARDLEINPNAHFGLEKYHLALLQYLVRDQKYQSRHVYVDEETIYFLGNCWTGDFRSNRIFDEDELKAKAESFPNTAAAEQIYKTLLQTNGSVHQARRMLATLAVMDAPPEYRAKWDLMADPNLEAGTIYMAQMNPKESACFVVMGNTAWIKGEYHLAVEAFDKAVALGSPQSEILKERATDLRQFIRESENQRRSMYFALTFGVVVIISVVFILGKIIRW